MTTFETHVLDHAESDPLAAFDALSGQPRWFWQDSEHTLLVWEPILTLTSQGENRFEQMATQVKNLPLEGEAMPILVGGFSFDDSTDWDSFPAGQLILPRFTLIWDGANVTRFLVTVISTESPSQAEARARQVLANTNTTPHNNISISADDLMSYAQWKIGVEDIKREIATGKLRKAVLARARLLDFKSAPNPTNILQYLGKNYPNTYRFCFEPQPGYAFIGASPELLVRTSGKKLETVALAGSAHRDDDPIADASLGSGLMRSAKNRHEQQLVVESIREALTPLTSNLKIPDKPRLLRVANILHLESPIAGNLKEAGILPVIDALHPTPALGGIPKDIALNIIRKHETVSRGWYGAPVGWMQPNGDGLFAVAIRSALLIENRARLYAGAGIVAGSDPQREWDETSLKFRPILQALETTQ